MPFCKRCGELARSEKCTKCGSTVQDRSASTCSTPSVDRWESSYLGSVIGLDRLSSTGNATDAAATAATRSPMRSPSSLLSRTRRPSSLASLWESKRIAPSPRPKAADKPSVAPPPVAPPPLTTTKTTTSKSKTKSSGGPCAECHKPLSGKTVRLPESTVRYHWACLKCAHCHDPFQDTSFYTDSAQKIYHPKCYNAAMADVTCVRCSSEIKEAYLVIHQARIHPKCFRCTSCKKVLSPSSIYVDMSPAAYCQPCGKNAAAAAANDTITGETRIVPQLHPPPASVACGNSLSPTALTRSMESLSTHSSQSSTPSSPSSAAVAATAGPPPAAKQQQQQQQQQAAVMPSSLMSRRAKPLPKFGMRKVCAGCNQTITSVHDEKPGPRATRWHKKCLGCQGCAKVLDSAAVVRENPATGGLDPWCRLCLLASNSKNQAIPNNSSRRCSTNAISH